MNVQVSYSITGKGPVVVWLHGFLEDKSIWQGQLNVFDTLATNICIDLLGHGQTNCVREEHSMELQAQMVIRVLDELGVCLLYTSPSPRDKRQSRMPSSA